MSVEMKTLHFYFMGGDEFSVTCPSDQEIRELESEIKQVAQTVFGAEKPTLLLLFSGRALLTENPNRTVGQLVEDGTGVVGDRILAFLR